jgi:hypothetical protein
VSKSYHDITLTSQHARNHRDVINSVDYQITNAGIPSLKIILISFFTSSSLPILCARRVKHDDTTHVRILRTLLFPANVFLYFLRIKHAIPIRKVLWVPKVLFIHHIRLDKVEIRQESRSVLRLDPKLVPRTWFGWKDTVWLNIPTFTMVVPVHGDGAVFGGARVGDAQDIRLDVVEFSLLLEQPGLAILLGRAYEGRIKGVVVRKLFFPARLVAWGIMRFNEEEGMVWYTQYF